MHACLSLCVRGMQDSGRLQDGAHQKPSYSLRTLCRALEYCRTALPLYGMQRALLDGLKMAFMTQLDPECAHIIRNLINVHVTGSAKPLKVWVIISADNLLALDCNTMQCHCALTKTEKWLSQAARPNIIPLFHIAGKCTSWRCQKQEICHLVMASLLTC